MNLRIDSTLLWICLLQLPINILGSNDTTADVSATNNVKTIPKGLKFGVATAAYQIEGGWNASDKSPSIWDVYCQQDSLIKDGTTGEDACKSYQFYKRDIQMIKFLGVDVYRFSISWPRLFPNGFTNVLSETGRSYYDNLINELLENKVEPVVTMYHWDLPQNLQDLGGWANPLIADWFEDYARMLYTLFGDRVKTWITVNEPKQFGIFGYGMKRMAPGLESAGIGDYIAVKNILVAHARAWHLYDKEFRDKQKGLCGIAIATDFREGASDSPEDIEVGLMAMDFEVSLYTHPIFSTEGGFPKRVVQRVAERSAQQGFSKSRLPQLSDEEREFIKGTSDFYGFNHYSSRFYYPSKPGTYPSPSYEDDIGGNWTYLDYKTAEAIIHCTSIPPGIRKALNWVRENCNNPQIMITENGYGTFGGIPDEDRVTYFKEYLSNVIDAVDDGCNVTTYTAWSLMDNFEWSSGLSIKFGLFEVDYEDEMRKRTARASAFWYKRLIETRTLDMSYEPEIQELSF